MLFDVKISKLFQRMEDAEKDATTDSTATCLHPPSPSSSSKPAENGTTVAKNDEELLADINSHYRKGLQLQRNSDTASGFREAADQFRHAIDIVVDRWGSTSPRSVLPSMHYGQCLLAIFRFKICCKDDDSESESAADDDENEEEEDETKGSKREKAVDLNKLYAEILGGIGIEGEEDPVAILDAIEVEGDEEEEGNDSILNEEDEPLPAEDEGAGENDLFAAAAAENGPNDHKKMKKCVETTADEENSDEGTSSESEDENDDAESEESVNDDLDSGVEDEEEAPKSKLLSMARTLFDEAVKICESQEDENDDPKCRLNKCEVFVSIGELSGLENNLDASIDEFGKALKIRKSLLEPSDRKIAEVSSLLAVTHRKKREHAMALKYFEETKEVLQKRLNHIVFQEMTMPASPSTIINSSSNPNNEANELRNLVKELEEEIRKERNQMESADENLDGSGKGESTNPEQNGFNQKEVKKESIEPEVAIGKDENLEQNGLDKKEVCIEPNAGVQTATQQEKEEEPPHAKRIRLEE